MQLIQKAYFFLPAMLLLVLGLAKVPVTDKATTSPVVWNTTASLAGNPVKVRVRGDTLVRLLEDINQWALLADGYSYPAHLMYPAAPTNVDYADYSVNTEVSEDDDDSISLIDRGELPQAINRLELTFAADRVLARARVDKSSDQITYVPACTEQIVFQQVKSTGIIKLTDIDCEVGKERYMRVMVFGVSSLRVAKAVGWYEIPPRLELYEVPSSLISMREGSHAGEHLWPLVLKADSLPLAKIKVIADAQNTARRIRIVRLDEQLAVLHTEAEYTWANELAVGNQTRTEKWVNFPPSSGPWSWGIMVEDNDNEALALKGVQSYAAEVWVCFERPETNDVTLLVGGDSQSLRVTLDEELELTEASYAGEIRDISSQHRLDSSLSTADHQTYFIDISNKHLIRITAYALAALVSLLIGTALIRAKVAGNVT